MSRTIKLNIMIFIMIVVTAPAVLSAEEMVELRLINDIDEDRGYCLDIAGGRGTDAPLDRGLQAHTCCDYTGSLLEDQSFDLELIDQGQFKIPYFDVCMSVAAIEINSAILLAPCENIDTQMFSLEPNGNLIVRDRKE